VETREVEDQAAIHPGKRTGVDHAESILLASNRPNNRLRTLVYMNMLNTHGLRTTIPQP
jgi:hypothetical protein